MTPETQNAYSDLDDALALFLHRQPRYLRKETTLTSLSNAVAAVIEPAVRFFR